MTELSRYQILDLLNRPQPLWLVNIDLGDANLPISILKYSMPFPPTPIRLPDNIL